MARTPKIDNEHFARVLSEVATQLELQWAPARRVEAFRRAAEAVERFDDAVQPLAVKGGREQAEEILDIGSAEAAAIEEIAHTGQLRLLDRLTGHVTPEELFRRVSGVSPVLARRIHRELAIDTLEDLEVAAHDGRLKRLTQYTPRRMKMIQNALARILVHSSRRNSRRFGDLARAGVIIDMPRSNVPSPGVSLLLKIDADYRDKVSANLLSKLKGPGDGGSDETAWPPILHTEVGDWQFTVMFQSPTRGADDNENRVVIFFERDGLEDQRTVVTEGKGHLAGRRVVAGNSSDLFGFHSNGLVVRSMRGSRRHSQPN
jgi:hypothetical protein